MATTEELLARAIFTELEKQVKQVIKAQNRPNDVDVVNNIFLQLQNFVTKILNPDREDDDDDDDDDDDEDDDEDDDDEDDEDDDDDKTPQRRFTPAFRPADTSSYSYQPQQQYGSYGSSYGMMDDGRQYGMMDYGRQAYNTMQDYASSLFQSPERKITESPESLTPLNEKENVVTVETLSRSGAQNVVKKVGLVGLRQVGQLFESIVAPEETPMKVPDFNP
jgi:hypothetical protein